MEVLIAENKGPLFRTLKDLLTIEYFILFLPASFQILALQGPHQKNISHPLRRGLLMELFLRQAPKGRN